MLPLEITCLRKFTFRNQNSHLDNFTYNFFSFKVYITTLRCSTCPSSDLEYIKMSLITELLIRWDSTSGRSQTNKVFKRDELKNRCEDFLLFDLHEPKIKFFYNVGVHNQTETSTNLPNTKKSFFSGLAQIKVITS